MPRLTRFLLRHKLAVVAAWLVVLVAGVAAAGVVPGRLSQEFSFPGEEGYEANVAILEAYGNGGPGNPLVPVVTLPEGTTGRQPRGPGRPRPGLRRGRRRPAAAGAGLAGHHRRPPPGGGGRPHRLRARLGPVQGPRGADPALAGTLADGLRDALPAGTTVQVTGLDALRTAAAEEPAGTGVLVETLVGAVGALVVLAFVFGSFLALVPLLIAAVAILTTFLAVLGLTGLVEVSFIVQFLVALIGLGVAVDYSLLVVTRWREELGRGLDREQAVQRAMATAGRAVVTSGGTVAVGLLALVLLPVPFLRSIGYAGLLIPLAATLATLTLLPVLLATVGQARLAGRPPGPPRPGAGGAGGPLWTRWATGVTRHRWLATLAALAVLPPLCVAALDLRLGEPPADVLARSGPAREALDRLERAGVGSALTPIEVLVPAGPIERRRGRAGSPEACSWPSPPPGRPGSAPARPRQRPAGRRDQRRRRRGDRRAGPRPGRGRAARGQGRWQRRPGHRRHRQPLQRLPADAGRRRPGHLRAAGPGVPLAAAGPQGDRAQPAVDRRRLRGAGAGLAGGPRLRGDLGDRPPGRSPCGCR